MPGNETMMSGVLLLVLDLLAADAATHAFIEVVCINNGSRTRLTPRCLLMLGDATTTTRGCIDRSVTNHRLCSKNRPLDTMRKYRSFRLIAGLEKTRPALLSFPCTSEQQSYAVIGHFV